MELFDTDELNGLSGKSGVNRIHELERLIKKHQDLYYNGESEISDAEFDALWDELKNLDEANPLLHRIGSDSGNFQKARHVMPMGSQEKASSPEEFFGWAKKHDYDEYLVEYKLDGASLELQYSGGKLLRAVTRGDGETGDVITENAKKMQGVVQILQQDFTGGIRGEVIMTHKVHAEFFSDKANCRNAANGLMKKKDGCGCEHLQLIAYDVWATEGNQPFSDEEQKLSFLKSSGFCAVPMKICRSVEEVVEFRSEVMENRGKIDYDIDGLVIKERLVNHEDALRARPDRQIAFKFSLEEAVSVVRRVEWNESGATYTPVAVFDAVELNGTSVKRASLVNPNLIRALNIKIGSHVVVVKRGEIIPKIMSVIKSADETQDVEFPQKCASCGAELVDEGTRLFCPNKNCGKRILHQLLKWAAVIDIRDLGETLLEKLFATGKIRSISALYKLTVKDLEPYFLNSESLGREKKSLGAEKVFASIQSRRKISLAKFVAGFDIEGIGEAMVEALVSGGFDSAEKIFNAKTEEIAAVYGFAEISAQNFVEGIAENRAEMESLLADGTILLADSSLGKLKGLTFCFTGELFSMKRSDAQNLVKENGGTVKSSVVKGLSFLVTNDTESGSAKNKKAQELGVKIISEKEFLAMV
jgi:DNA ligase (NAD+)